MNLKPFLCLFFLGFYSIIFAQTAKDYFISGNQKDKAGDTKGAIIDFTKSIELDSTRYQTYNNRGISKNNMGDTIFTK